MRKNCKKEPLYVIQVMGGNFGVCRWHKFINPISQIIINLRIKIDFAKNGIGWGMYAWFDDVIPRKD